MCPVNTLPNSAAYLNKNGKSVTSNFRTLHVSPKAYSSVFQLMHTHDKWPYKIENAFTSALRTIIKTGTSKIKIRNKNYGRNELISLYIKYETGEVRTKKQISSHIQVWKKSILNKISNHMFLTPFDTEMLNLIERGAEQNERTLSHFYALFEKIIDTLSKCETINAGIPASSSGEPKNITRINSALVSGPSGIVEQDATVSDTNSTTSTGVFSTTSAPTTDISTDLSASDTSVEADGKSTTTRPHGPSTIGSTLGSTATTTTTTTTTTHYYHDYVSGAPSGHRSSILAGKAGKYPLDLHGNNIDTDSNDNININNTLTAGLRGLPPNNPKRYYSLEDIPYNHGSVTIPPLTSEPIQSLPFSKGMRVVSNPETTGLMHVNALPRPTLKRTIDSDFTTADYDNNAKRIKLPPVYRNSSNSSSSVSISTTSSRIPSGASIASSGSSTSSGSVTGSLDSPIDPKSVILPSLYQPVHQSFTTTDSYLHPQTMLLRSSNNTAQILPGPKVQPLSTFPQQLTTLNHVPIMSTTTTTTQRRFSRGGVDILPPLRNMKLRGENRNVTLQTTDFGTQGAAAVTPAALMQVGGGVYKLDEIKKGL